MQSWASLTLPPLALSPTPAPQDWPGALGSCWEEHLAGGVDSLRPIWSLPSPQWELSCLKVQPEEPRPCPLQGPWEVRPAECCKVPRGPPPAGNALHLTREETWASAPRPLPVRASGNSRPLFARAPAAATREKEAERRQVPTRWCSLDLPGTLQSARAAGASAAHRSAGHGAGSATVTRLPRAALGTARYSVHSRLKERHIGHVLQQPAVALET